MKSKNIKIYQLSTAVTSSALQDHLIRNSNLGLMSFSKQISYPKRKTLQKLPSLKKTQELQKLQKQEKHSILPYEDIKIKKMKEAVEQQQKFNQYNKKLTLAQRLGLIEPPPPPLSNNQWEEIQEKSRNRNDSDNVCSICLEDFKIEPQIILSCSHVFHGKCLNSYEKHNKVRCCPICRKRDYQKKIIDDAIRKFTLKSIIRIQKTIRGSRERINVYSKLIDQCYCAKSKLFNRRLIGFKMWKLSNKIKDKVKRDGKMFKDMLMRLQNKHIKDTKDIVEEMVQIQRKKMKNEGEIHKYLEILGVKKQSKAIQQLNWEQIKEKGIERHQDQCAICLMSLWTKPVYLLSCTHLFHVNCIQGLQRYALAINQSQCPCCRTHYSKKLIQNNNSNKK